MDAQGMVVWSCEVELFVGCVVLAEFGTTELSTVKTRDVYIIISL